jgi:L-fuconolactonase
MDTIDAHQHVWDLEAANYPWLTPALAPLDRSYSLHDAAADMQACGIGGTVLVQAADNTDDTTTMLRAADAHVVVVGVVGWLPLDEPEETAATLDRWDGEPRLVGVRHLIHEEPDPNWLLRATVLESLGLVAARGLAFDVCAERPELLAHVPVLAERFPDLPLVIDHLAKPPIRERGWEPWAGLLEKASAAPNVFAKISGLNTVAGEGWTSDDFRRYVDYAVSLFGCDRLMCGSDWPFALLAARSYADVWTATIATVDRLDPRERSAVLSGTARRVYRLPVASR